MRVRTVHRITGPHLLLGDMGAAVWLEDIKEEELKTVYQRIEMARTVFGWGEPVCRTNDMGYSIALEAPVDQLYAACTLLEWACEGEAWSSAVVERIQKEEDENLSLRRSYDYCVAEKISYTIDEDFFVIGYGVHSQHYSFDSIPIPQAISQPDSIPVVAITGTNGKTTTSRMLAAIAAKDDHCVGATSSDGVVINGDTVVRGDWTGAGAARKVLRDSRVTFAILETARGGLMRRGMVIRDIDVVGITNVSRDHFGSWGINSLEELQRAKLSIIYSIKPNGLVVFNKEHTKLYTMFLEEFYPKRPDIKVVMYSMKSTDTLVYCHDGAIYLEGVELCSCREIPLTLEGHAKYNIENALLAIVMAYAQGISRFAIREGLFSLSPNPEHSYGRSNLFFYRGGRVIVDFAHNEAGIQAVVELVQSMNPKRSIMVLGQAGDRGALLLQGMAHAAATLNCTQYFIKEIHKHNEHRSAKETARILHDAILEQGIDKERVQICRDERTAAEQALSMIEQDDVLLLLSHTHYTEIIALLKSSQ